MKKYISEFLRRGFAACGIGPLVLAVLYLIMQAQGLVQTLTVNEVCMGIFSLTALAFIAGGMNFIYQIEKLPLMLAILIHGGILYISYLTTFILNGWLAQGFAPFLIFSLVFIAGYFVIWAIIYAITRRNTAKLNELLLQKQNGSQTN